MMMKVHICIVTLDVAHATDWCLKGATCTISQLYLKVPRKFNGRFGEANWSRTSKSLLFVLSLDSRL
jgi:hypothetical protein